MASTALAALTAAAWLLPGLAPLPATAQLVPEDGWAAQVSRHQEAPRTVPGAPNAMAPLTAETLVLRGSVATRHGGLAIGYQQDSWSGATPVSTAPGSAQGNRMVLGDRAGQLVVVGASPMLIGSVLLDCGLRPVTRDAQGRLRADSSRVHTLASASPETRQQLDLRLTRPAVEGDWQLGAGVSLERDFRSRFVSLGRRLAFDERRSTLHLTLGATRSDTEAALDHDAAPYITKVGQPERVEQRAGQQWLRGRRDELSAAAAWVQVLGPAALFEAQLVHQRGRGYLGVPYKLVSTLFVAPEALAAAGPDEAAAANLQALLERRPDQRRQWQFNGRLVLHHAASDGALHLGYGHFRDDWGLRAHRLEAEWLQPAGGGWMAAARMRYYTQGAARFYQPWLVSTQAYRRVDLGPDGQPRVTMFDPALLPAHYSSDARLAGFGSLAGGLSLSKPLGAGLVLELGLDLTRQAGRLKAGGDGDAGVGDLRHRLLHAGLRWDLQGLAAPPGAPAQGAARGGAGASAAHALAHSHPADGLAPPGLLALHEADAPGHWMLAYRQQLRREGSALQHGTQRVDDAEISARACGAVACLTRPAGMAMRMHMVELMRSLGDGVSVMLMPQFMTMQMDMRLLPGAVAGEVPPHVGRHESSGLGDTVLQLQWQPQPPASAHAHAQAHAPAPADAAGRWSFALGLGLPTGDSGLRQRRSHQQDGRLLAPAMQAGSGSWDWLASLAWQAETARLAGGLQASAVLRPGAGARERWRLGHRLQTSAWAATRLAGRWQASLRLGHTWTGPMRGGWTVAEVQSPDDLAANHGGQLTELGLGLRWASAPAAGGPPSSLALEWQHTVHARLRGYQPAPGHGLLLSWQQAF